MAVFPWMDDAANMVVFGDSRGGSANFQTFENLLTYYTGTDNKEGVEKVASALNKGISQKKYSRNNLRLDRALYLYSYHPVCTCRE
ncbi:hypothetical protein NXX77_22060 [Phocaeicola dorei]|nr:hypothetical protein [Phocaeicola dorei]